MRSWKLLVPLVASSLCFAAQPDRIPGAVDSGRMVVLAGNVHRMAQPKYDVGPVDDSLPFGRVTLIIPPSPAQQAALDQLLAQQQDPASPNFRKWLTPAQYADRFGLSQNDIGKITNWLQSQGLQILSVGGGRNSVVFSGTAGQIQAAFKTEIHRYNVNGRIHVANSAPLSVPAAFGGIVTGVRGLTDFRPKPMYARPAHGGKSSPHPSYTTNVGGTTEYFLAPGDVATLYDLNPLYNTSINGAGQKIAIIGQTDVYLADLNAFRSGFGLNTISGCTTSSSGIITACDSTYFQYIVVPGISDLGAPSTCGDIVESDLDLEWSGAVAPNAQIVFVNAPAIFSSDCTEITNGGGVDAALNYAIDPPSGYSVPAQIISLSYSACEADADLPAESIESLLQQGSVEGITVMNSAGDTASAACDYDPPENTANPPYAAVEYGLAVGYPASSPWVTGVGGTAIPNTEFSGTYWNSNGTSTTSVGASAQSNLIGTEIPWNDNPEWAAICNNNTSSFCEDGGSNTGVKITSAETAQEDLWLAGGGGGVSNCFNSSGTVCESGIAIPTWQQGMTNLGLVSPQTSYRMVPDVSLIGSANFPGYIFCTPVENLSNTSPYDTETSSSCGSGGASGIQTAADGTVSGENFVVDPSIIGGTSASSPVFAGIVALLNQYLGSTGLGSINPTLYTLAASNSTNHAFHHITTGNSDVYCQGETPSGNPADVICPGSSGTTGVIGFNASNSDPTKGYNVVTGLGSVDAYNLATAWAAGRTTASSVAISPSSTTVIEGTSVTFSVTVTPSSGVGSVAFSTLNGTTTTALGSTTLNTPYGTASTGTATFSTSALPAGSNMVTATYGGDATHNGSTSTPVAVTVTIPYTLTTPLAPITVAAGQSASSVITIVPTSGFTGAVNFNSGASPAGGCTAGLPAGATCTFNPTSITLDGVHSQNVTLTIATTPIMALPSGAQTITVSSTTGAAVISTSVALTVNATNQSFSIGSTAATYSVAAGSTASVPITVTGNNGFVNSSSNTTIVPITYSCLQSSVPSEATCNFSPSDGSAVSATSVTLAIATTAPTSELRWPLRRGSRMFYALLLPGMFGMLLGAGSRRRGIRLLGFLVVFGLFTLGLGSCGGSSGSSGGQSNPGTPAGSYKVVVNATTAGPNALTSTFTVTLNVTQ
jgi:hypothetical protein